MRVGGDVQRPEVVHEDSSALEALRGRYRWSTCILEAVVTSEGRVDSVNLLRPENAAPEARRVLTEMLEGWVFEPATLGGESVDVSYTLLIHHCPSIAPGPPSGVPDR